MTSYILGDDTTFLGGLPLSLTLDDLEGGEGGFALGEGGAGGGFSLTPNPNPVMMAGVSSSTQSGSGDPEILPDLYEYLPLIIRNLDQEVIGAPGAPALAWDNDLTWDQTPYVWDDLLAPEPLLRTTLRIQQIELEKIARQIEDLTRLYDIDTVDPQYLPYLGNQLGTIPPDVSASSQRAFLDRLVEVYRRKGTLQSFESLFAALGFEVLILERYQRRADAAFVQGPQTQVVRTSDVLNEPGGPLTFGSSGPYALRLGFFPISRGSIRLSVYSKSPTTPQIISDDGNGGWSGGFSGSIDYSTGVGSITLKGVPAFPGNIFVNYQYLPDPFPDTQGLRWQNQWRSSEVGLALTPHPGLDISATLAERVEVYTNLLKPAHVIFSELAILLNLSDTITTGADELNPQTLLHNELVWGTPYYGHGYDSTLNASIDPDDGTTTPHRDGGEYLKTTADPDLPVDVYPHYFDGKYFQPYGQDNPKYPPITGVTADFEDGADTIVATSGENWVTEGLAANDWIEVTGAVATAGVNNRHYRISSFSTTTTTNDTINVDAAVTPIPTDETSATIAVARDTFYEDVPGEVLPTYVSTVFASTIATNFTILDMGSTTLGVGDILVFRSGANKGMWATLLTFADSGSFYALTVDVPSHFSSYWVKPKSGDGVTILSSQALNYGGLDRRAVDPLDIVLIWSVASDNVQTVFDLQIPLNSGVSIVEGSMVLDYTEGTARQETDSSGSWTNTNGDITSSSIDYSTGEVDITWTNAPDASEFTISYLTTETQNAGY